MNVDGIFEESNQTLCTNREGCESETMKKGEENISYVSKIIYDHCYYDHYLFSGKFALLSI